MGFLHTASFHTAAVCSLVEGVTNDGTQWQSRKKEEQQRV